MSLCEAICESSNILPLSVVYKYVLLAECYDLGRWFSTPLNSKTVRIGVADVTIVLSKFMWRY
jgi:hypothetical protein